MPSAPEPDAYDVALYGRDRTERIVGLHLVAPGDDGVERMRVYRRTGPDTVEHEDAPFYPFFFLSDADLLRDFPRDRFRFQELGGEGFFRWLVVFPNRSAYWDALRHIERVTDTNAKRPEEVYFAGSPEQQYLMQTGRTLFKGMPFEDLYRMQLDIETYASAGGFPNAERPGDAVIIVSLSDNRGWTRLLDARSLPEKTILQEVVRLIREKDPDVIEGHNAYAFDFPYLMTRCARHGVPFAIGRDGSVPRSFPSSMRFAERSIDFPALDIAGRHVIDTYFQVMSYDVFKRDLPAYGLKAAAKYFGFAPEGRTYVDGADIPRVWDEDPERLLAYALDDVIETERLSRHLSGSTFYLTQMVPMPYDACARTGPASKIEALFVREYLRRRQALPKAEWGSQVVGGYTDVFVTGVVGPVVYADVESLYPSIMLNYGVQPKGDTLGLFPGLLRTLTELRFETKSLMRTADGEQRGELDARQTAYKNIINSFYGNMGFGMAIFNDFAEADRVASVGQDLLRRIIRAIRERGGTVVEVDTDGVLFVPPDDVRGDAAERAFVAALSDALPDGIRVGFDGRFQKMLSYKKKNYALLGYDGTLKFKGSSLVSRSSERFGRRFLRQAVPLLLDEDIQGLHDLYLRTRDQIIAHDWEGVESFQRTETLKDTPEQYLADVEAGKRTRAASYELAIRRMEATGQPIVKGDRISYYLTGSAANITAFENARLADAWDPTAPDENTAYYLKRLDEFAAKFAPFFPEHDFRLVFSPEDLFGFDPSGITLQRTERAPEEVEDDVPF
jgi:DNA polymerase elongation subunit (family B)